MSAYEMHMLTKGLYFKHCGYQVFSNIINISGQHFICITLYPVSMFGIYITSTGEHQLRVPFLIVSILESAPPRTRLWFVVAAVKCHVKWKANIAYIFEHSTIQRFDDIILLKAIFFKW